MIKVHVQKKLVLCIKYKLIWITHAFYIKLNYRHDLSDHEENISVEQRQSDMTGGEQGHAADISQTSSSSYSNPKRRWKQRTVKNNIVCNTERRELIHQALAKMIAINQMPISFCSSQGFRQFMTTVDRGILHAETMFWRNGCNYWKGTVRIK